MDIADSFGVVPSFKGDSIDTSLDDVVGMAAAKHRNHQIPNALKIEVKINLV